MANRRAATRKVGEKQPARSDPVYVAKVTEELLSVFGLVESTAFVERITDRRTLLAILDLVEQAATRDPARGLPTPANYLVTESGTLAFPETGAKKTFLKFLPPAMRVLQKVVGHPEIFHEFERRAKEQFEARLPRPKFLIGSNIRPGGESAGDGKMPQYKNSFVNDGVRYFSVASAAEAIQAPRSTILDWMNKQTKFDGAPLIGVYLPHVDRYFIAEESIYRAALRFVKWPSEEPAGYLKIGETTDGHGYITLPKAAHKIGVSPRTMWLWATARGKAPIPDPLAVIKCPASDQFYILESDVWKLKEVVPRSGLRRGRRTQPPEPS
jgi:hypothetical protein